MHSVDLVRWNYHIEEAKLFSEFYDDLDIFWGIADALWDLKVSDEVVEQGGSNVVYCVSHGRIHDRPYREQTYRVNGKQYQVRATFTFSTHCFNKISQLVLTFAIRSTRQMEVSHPTSSSSSIE